MAPPSSMSAVDGQNAGRLVTAPTQSRSDSMVTGGLEGADTTALGTTTTMQIDRHALQPTEAVEALHADVGTTENPQNEVNAVQPMAAVDVLHGTLAEAGDPASEHDE